MLCSGEEHISLSFRTMQKGSLSGRGHGPTSLHIPQQCTRMNYHQSSRDSRGNLRSCRPSPLPLYEDLRRQRDALRAKLEEARHRFAAKTRELHEAARQSQQRLANSLRSKWEQRLFRELHQLKEETRKKREAEIRQLLRWKKAELCEAQKFLKQERDAAIRKARDFQFQLAKELVSHGSGRSAAECHTKLEEVLGKLRWEFDGDQATQIRHLEAELELERRVFMKYVLEHFEGVPLLAGSLPGFTQASLTLEGQVTSWGAAGEHAQETSSQLLELSTESYNQLEKQHTGLLNAVRVLAGRCIHLQEENTLLRENSFPDTRDRLASSPLEDNVNSWGADGECTPESLLQPHGSSGHSYDQLMKQNRGLLSAVKVLVRRCIQLQEDNALLRDSRATDTQDGPSSSSPEDILSNWRVSGERGGPGGLSEDSYNQLMKQNADLMNSLKILEEKSAAQLAEKQKQCEHLRHEVEGKRKQCEEAEVKLCETLRESAKLSEERNSAVRLTQGLEVKVQNLEQLVKDMKERTERLEEESWGAVEEIAQEGLPQPVELPGNSYSQLTKQNADLFKSWKILEERCIHLEEDNALLREGRFPGLQDKVKILRAKGVGLAAIARQLQEAVKNLQEFHLRVPNTSLQPVPTDFVKEVSGNYLFDFIPSERKNEPSSSCQSSSCEENNSSDEERCDSLLTDSSEGTLCEVPAEVPYPQNLTVLILRSITTTSAEITWFPSNGNYAHLVYLNEKKYDVTKAGICCYAFQNLRPSTKYRVRVEPVVPQEIFLFPQGGQEKAREIVFTTLSDGPPHPPIELQIPAGGSADFLVISWLPATIPPSASSNGVRVTGYAIYISGEKVAEIMSPTAGSGSSEVSQRNTF